MNLQNLRLTTKLWLSVLLIVLALVTVVGYTAYRTAENRAESAQALHKLNARVNASLGWAGLTQTNAARTQAIMLSSDPVLEAGLKEAMADTTAQISKIQKTIEDDELTDDDRQQMKVIAAN
ncbi:methyl-accepting chemotaxis protein, partial [Rhodoferax fermentans]